jgi:tetratricopeptide (TPR) repeat protein
MYRDAIGSDPENADGYVGLGEALDAQHAAAAFDRSLALEPTSSAYSNSGTVYYFLGRYADAARMFTRATELTAHDHRVWGNLADALWQVEGSRAEAQSDYRRAIALALKSLEVNSRDAVSWSQLAYYSARARADSDVQGYTSRALQLNPDDPNVRYYGALTALELGDPATALESLSRAVTLGYPASLVRAAPDFASLRSDARFRQLLAQADQPPAG